MRLQKTVSQRVDTRVRILTLCRRQVRDCTVPIVTLMAGRHDPYLVLISCILSLRTQDKTTGAACRRLFDQAATPRAMAALSAATVAKLIYPVGFYRTKARVLVDISAALCDRWQGQVPATRDALLSLKGVGRKTANLVLGLGFSIPAICVDTHVHRISNRLGWVKTRTPEETEYALERQIPKRWWIELNTILVTFGQHICQPVSPLCSACSVKRWCNRIGVGRSR